MKATADSARAARARLRTTLRNACAVASRQNAPVGHSLAESDFLREMAWTPGPADPRCSSPNTGDLRSRWIG